MEGQCFYVNAQGESVSSLLLRNMNALLWGGEIASLLLVEGSMALLRPFLCFLKTTKSRQAQRILVDKSNEAVTP